MFKIYDGRDSFFQWDLEQKLIIEDASINEVHFCNRTDDCSLVCEVYDENGLRVVNVPNILLQDNWAINVYAYCTNYTKYSATFKVNKRSKPEDYMYTETEVKTWDELEQRVAALEEGGTGGGSVDVDLSNYYTKGEVDAAIDVAIDEALTDIPEVEIEEEVYIGTEQPADGAKIWIDTDAESIYYTKDEVDALIPSVEGYATEQYVNDLVGNINTLLDDINGEVI